MENCEKVVFHSKKERKMSMRKRIVRQVIAMVLCVCMALGLFDGIPVVKEYVRTSTEAEAASGYDEKVSAFINDYRWRNGASWGNRRSILSPQLGGVQCCAYASDFVKYVFGMPNQKSGEYYSDISQIRAGDTIYVGNWHWLVVLYRDGSYLYTAEGNYNQRVRVRKYGYRIEGNKIINNEASSYRYTFTKGYHYNTGGVASSINYQISTCGASNISNNDARILGSMSPAGNVNSWGFYVGPNTGAMAKITVSGQTYSGNMGCNIGNYYKLNYGTTYYYKIWAVVNGQEKQGAVSSFRTTATKPDIPTLKIASNYQNIGLESSATVNWNATGNARYYKAYLYNSDNELVETSEQITGTKYAFKAAQKVGTYYAKVEAYNEVGTKGQSNEVSFTVHPDVTVTFVDADSFVDVPAETEPVELGKQTIHYGGTANAPADPEHTGYTFKKWSKSFSNVKEDLVVKAEYQINRYTVRYVDSTTQEVLGTEEVDYYSSANPVDFKVPTGYVKTGYDGWDKDYKCITANTTLNTCIGWYNENFPIYAELLSAVRDYDAEESDNEGYTIKAKVTNWDKSTTKGRVVVALKTKAGKLLTSTESSAFSVKKNTDKTIEVFVPYDKAASLAEIYVVGQYTDAVPITTTTSNNAVLEIDQSSVYTNWSTEEAPEDAVKKEERKEYRYQDKQTTSSYETSLSGYTCSGSSWVHTGSNSFEYVASFPYGFDTGSSFFASFNRAPVTPSETYTNKTTVSTSFVGNVYYHWCRNGNYGAINRTVNGTYTDKFWKFHIITDAGLGWNSVGAFYAKNASICGDSYWWIGYGEGNAANTPILRCNYNTYRKRFDYYKWTDYSEWSTTKQAASSTRNVQERKVYRYLTDEMMQEDSTGKERTVSGALGKEFAGKEATLFVYKVDEASDYTNEYVAQTKLDEDGKYKFTFKLREEPSIKTGDMTVVLGVEGTSTAIYLDTIKAPKKTHKVRFYDYNGKVISEQDVEDGYAAELPSQEETKRTGYTFVKWSDTNINITEDKDIYAEYELNKYDVVFVDWKANSVKVEQFEYGARLLTPVAEEPEENQIVEWDKVADGVETVTENLVVCTRYKTKTFDVKIQGFDGKIISEQTIEYGKAVQLPELDAEANNCIFCGWKNVAHGQEKEFTDVIIKEDTTLVPDFVYKETVSNPTANLDSGEYDKEQTVTLSTDTKEAEIYYTLDGSDPHGATAIKYTKPIEIDDATILKYYAKATQQNDSEVIENYYVINYAGARSAWMPYAELPEKVKENQKEYDIYSDTGYALKEKKQAEYKDEAKELENLGWTKGDDSWSEYTEWQDTPFIDEAAYIEAQVETQAVYSSSTKYKYSHYVYTDGTATCYSPKEIDGKDCKYETIELDKSMAIAGFKEEGKTYFIRDGVEWFQQEKVIGKTQTGIQYRQKHKIVNYVKLVKYITDIPSDEKLKDYTKAEVFSYVRHNSYIVNIYALTNKLQTQIVEEGKTIETDDLEEIEGYNIDSIYKDAEYTQKWNAKTDKVTGNLSLYVKMQPKKYDVTFKEANGKKIETQKIDYLDEAAAPEPVEVEGKKFIGWSTDEYKCVTQDIDVVAKYVPEEDYAMIAMESDEKMLKAGETFKISSQITPISQSEVPVYWDSEDNSVAVVSDQGVVTAIGEGETTIVATVSETGEKAQCKIKVLGEEEQPTETPTQSPKPIKTFEPATPTPVVTDEPNVTSSPSVTASTKPTTTPKPIKTLKPTQKPMSTPLQNTTSDKTPEPAIQPQPIAGPVQKTDNTQIQPNANTTTEKLTWNKQVKLKTVKALKKGKIKATWKKLTNVSGYQIQYAPNKKFKKAKRKTVKSTSVTIKKLKKKKTYFVRVRAYKLADGKKVYGKWSSVKKVKIKK